VPCAAVVWPACPCAGWTVVVVLTVREFALGPRRRVMSVGFVSRVTTCLRRRVPKTIFRSVSEVFFKVEEVLVTCVVKDKLLLEVFDDDGGVGCLWY